MDDLTVTIVGGVISGIVVAVFAQWYAEKRGGAASGAIVAPIIVIVVFISIPGPVDEMMYIVGMVGTWLFRVIRDFVGRML